MTWMERIARSYGEEYILRQLAEESAELTQAVLKMVRVMNEETPIRWTEVENKLLEEIADVEVMLHILKAAVLDARANEQIADIFARKEERMQERLLEKDELDRLAGN